MTDLRGPDDRVARPRTWATKPPEVYLQDLRGERARTRRQAAAALQVLGDPRAVGALAATLTDAADEGVRAVAARALGALRDHRAVAPLLTALRDPHPDVRCAVTQALWRLGDRRAVAGLADALRDSHPLVRYFAGRALIHRYVPGGIHPPLIGSCGTDAALYRLAQQAIASAVPGVPPPESSASGLS